MNYVIQDFVSVQRLTPGRRLIALQRMADAAARHPAVAGLTPAFQAALLAQKEALTIADAWRAAAGDMAMHADGARELDAGVDRAVAALHGAIEGIASSFDSADAALARYLLDEVFPAGVAPLTSLPFVDQHAAVGAMVARIRQDRLGAAIEVLELERWVARVDELNVAYGKALTRPERLSYDTVREADTRSYVALVEVVARILGLFPTNSSADVEGRTVLLQPLVDQQREFTLLRARRRSPGVVIDGVVPEALDPDDFEAEVPPEAAPEAAPQGATEAAPEETAQV